MTLIEAIKSGRPFRRCEGHWHSDGTSWVRTRALGGPAIDGKWLEDILADDWEIQEPKVEITRAQLKAAIRDTCEYYGLGPTDIGRWPAKDETGWECVVDYAAYRLGLGEAP